MIFITEEEKSVKNSFDSLDASSLKPNIMTMFLSLYSSAVTFRFSFSFFHSIHDRLERFPFSTTVLFLNKNSLIEKRERWDRITLFLDVFETRFSEAWISNVREWTDSETTLRLTLWSLSKSLNVSWGQREVIESVNHCLLWLEGERETSSFTLDLHLN